MRVNEIHIELTKEGHVFDEQTNIPIILHGDVEPRVLKTNTQELQGLRIKFLHVLSISCTKISNIIEVYEIIQIIKT